MPAKKAAPARPAAAQPDPPHLKPLREQLGPRLRAELDKVRVYEPKILRALANPETAARYQTDPGGVLRELGVEIPPIMAKRLKNPAATPAIAPTRQFMLPSGQVMTANVRVRFVAETSKSGGAGQAAATKSTATKSSATKSTGRSRRAR